MSINSWIDERIAKVREDAINQLLEPESLKKIADVLSGEVKQALSEQTSELLEHLGEQTNKIVDNVGQEFDKNINSVFDRFSKLLDSIPQLPSFPNIFGQR